MDPTGATKNLLVEGEVKGWELYKTVVINTAGTTFRLGASPNGLGKGYKYMIRGSGPYGAFTINSENGAGVLTLLAQSAIGMEYTYFDNAGPPQNMGIYQDPTSITGGTKLLPALASNGMYMTLSFSANITVSMSCTLYIYRIPIPIT